MAQTLETVIAINAKTGPGFSDVGNTLTQLGSIINGMSQELISFGEDSIRVYRDYEKSMKDAEVALSTTYGRGTRQLSKVMSELDESATEWAASTIFHTNDVANAISEAAHAGWDYERIMAGIPAAMQLAQAGGLDLSEAVNYIVKSTNAAGVGFEDLTGFIDLWTYAANSSASDVREFGDAMLRMGSTMRFAGSTEELMTLIAVTANAGSVGGEAGTMIRNSMMRLIAPTKKAADTMAELGVDAEEASELMNDVALAEANATLEAKGFSAFDERGNLKNILDVYTDLYHVLGDVAGSYENIDKNEDALQILSAIFPTRTISEALTLIRSAANEYEGLFNAMVGGRAKDYGAYAAATMMDTLDGKIETFGSKLERLKQVTGERLSGDLIGFLDSAGGFVDNLATMDEGKFSALVSGLEVIAAAGPALLTAGAAFRFLGLLANPAGLLGVGAVGIAAIANSLRDISEMQYENQFGLGTLNRPEITAGIKGLSRDFEEAYQQVDAFRQAVNESKETYSDASATFGSELLSKMLSGSELTKKDTALFNSLGKQMQNAVIEGIKQDNAGTRSYFTMLFGGEESDDLQNILDASNDAFSESIAQAEEIGQRMKEAMTSAFADGELSSDEYDKIMGYVRSMNKAMAEAAAEAQAEEDYVSQKMLLHRAQTASLDEIEAVTQEIKTERERVLGEAEDAYLRERYKAEYNLGKSVEAGKTSRAEMKSALDEIDRRYEQQTSKQNAAYDNALLALMDSQLKQSGLSDAYNVSNALAYSYLTGGMTFDQANWQMEQILGGNKYAGESDWLGNNQRTQLSEAVATTIDALGGYEALEGKIMNYISSGDMQSARSLAQLYAAQQINDAGARTEMTKGAFGRSYVDSSYLGLGINDMQFPQFQAFLGSLDGLFGDSDIMVSVIPIVDQEALKMDPVPLPIEPRLDESVDPAQALADQGVEVEVGADTESLKATIMAEDGQNLLQYVDGDATDLAMSIAVQDGKTLIEHVTGDASSLAAIINSYSGKTITVNIAGRKLFATGGRATEASIFGEAGPEWAIPEQHTQNTADLLNAAREASGFTWADLIGRTGGMNSGSGRAPTTIIYSPTVNAANAAGVEDVLKRDKERLDEWWRNKIMRDEMEVYA